MDEALKHHLHTLVDNCDNELLLEEAKNILENSEVKDWWDELTVEDKNGIAASELQYEKGDFINHTELMQQFEAWKKK